MPPGLPVPCKASFSNIKALQKHLRMEHGVQFCRLCVAGKPVFPSELQRFPVQGPEYERHMTVGDPKAGFNGHPRCSWCKERFYGNEQLTKHFTENHFACHICDKLGVPNKWFKDYQSLDIHFSDKHYPCHDPQCRARRFVAFEDEFQLQAHVARHHPNSLRKGAIRFNYQPRSATEQDDPAAAAEGPGGGARGGDAEGASAAEVLRSTEAFPTLAGDVSSRPLIPATAASGDASSAGEPMSSTPFGAWSARHTPARSAAAAGRFHPVADFPTLGGTGGGVTSGPARNRGGRAGRAAAAPQGVWAKASEPPEVDLVHATSPVEEEQLQPPPPPPQRMPTGADFPVLGGSAAPAPSPSSTVGGGVSARWSERTPAASAAVAGPGGWCDSCGAARTALLEGLCPACHPSGQWPSMAGSAAPGVASQKVKKKKKAPSKGYSSSLSSIASYGKGGSSAGMLTKKSTGLKLVRNSAVTGKKG
uniref:C2H2-type domain-containing protein n=1 Tax=Rhizochromulina marina TaxID=1034831 RepID=A0A7S2WW84_9STRA